MKKWSFFLLIVTLFISSCKDIRKKEDLSKVIIEWTGKGIVFPENIPCYTSGKETHSNQCYKQLLNEYRIFLYIDSIGCSSCRLQLPEWKQLIKETDSLFSGKVGFLFFFQPKNIKEFRYIFARERFDYPLFIDTNGSINNINHLPKETQYQCFLLDKDNKVVMIGNPVSNPNIWELYKKQISGK